MAVGDAPVYDIYYQLPKDDGELIPGNQPSANMRGSDFSDIGGSRRRRQPDTDSPQNPVHIEHHQYAKRRFPRLEKKKFRIGRPQGWQDKQNGSQQQGIFPTDSVWKEPRDDSADNTADQGGRDGDAVGKRSKIQAVNQINFDRLLRSRDDRSIVSEEQPSQSGNQRDGRDIQDTPAIAHRFQEQDPNGSCPFPPLHSRG